MDQDNGEYSPVRVHVTGSDVQPAAARPRAFRSVITRTVLLTATNPVRPLMARDTSRRRALAQVTGNAEVIGANPAPGADFIWTNTTGIPQEVTAAFASLAADATVANRFAAFKILDALGNRLAQAGDGTATTAGLTLNVSVYQGAAQFNTASGGPACFPLPFNLTVPPNGQFRFTGQDAAATDQWSNVTISFNAAALLCQSHSDALNSSGLLIAGGADWAELNTTDEVWVTAPLFPAFVSLVMENDAPAEAG